MTTNTIRKAALAVALTLSAGGAFAQSYPSSLEPFDVPLDVRTEAARPVVVPQRPLTVMGMTGGIEAKDPENTGTIGIRPDTRWQARGR